MGVLDWWRVRKERKEKESALANAELQLNDLKRLRREIERLIRAITRVGGDPKERLFLSVGEIRSITPRAMQIFNELKKIKRIERIEVDELIRRVKHKFKTKETKDLEKELKIEEELRNKTLTFEGFFGKLIERFNATGERKHIYPFFTTALEMVDAEIKLAEEEIKKLSEEVRNAA